MAQLTLTPRAEGAPELAPAPADRSRQLRSWVLTIGIALVATARVVGPKSGLDFWYDEMWRLDLLRRAHWRATYATEATPLPPLWFLLLRQLERLHHFTPRVVRGLAALFVTFAPVGLVVLTKTILEGRRRVAAGALLAGCGVTLAVMAGGFAAEIFSYVNSYAFEGGVVLLALALCAAAPRELPLPVPARVAIIVAPAATIGGLLLLPGIGLALLWRAVRHAVDRRAALVVLAGTVALSGVTAVLSYLFMYRDALGRDSTAEFFAADRFTGGVLDMPKAIEGFVRGSLAWNYPGQTRFVVALALVGFVVVAVRRPLVALSLGLGLVGLMLASKFAGFPGTANRVSAPLVLLVCLLPPLAVAEAVVSAVGRIRPAVAGVVAGVLLAVAAMAWWTPQDDEPPYRGLRGITADMAPIAASPYEDNVVVTYHWMTKWSAHDLLVNGGTGDRRFVIIGEDRDLEVEYIALEQPVYTDLPGLVRRTASPRAAIWCVVPYDVGPEAGTRACQLGSTGRERVVVRHGERGEITLWKPLA